MCLQSLDLQSKPQRWLMGKWAERGEVGKGQGGCVGQRADRLSRGERFAAGNRRAIAWLKLPSIAGGLSGAAVAWNNKQRQAWMVVSTVKAFYSRSFPTDERKKMNLSLVHERAFGKTSSTGLERIKITAGWILGKNETLHPFTFVRQTVC